MCRKLAHLVSFVLAFVLFGSTCWGLENQIINGEFDAGIEPWQISPGDGYSVEVVQGAGLSGTHALKIDILDAAAQDSIVVFQGSIVLEQPAVYPIGFTAKAQADREMLVLLEKNQSIYWLEWVDLTTYPQTFTFEYIDGIGGTNFTLSFILKHPWWSVRNENDNIDVYIDRVYLGDERPRDPNLAYNPKPPDGSIHNDVWAILSWSKGRYADSHNLYIGDNFHNVKDGTGDTFWGNCSTMWAIVGLPDYLRRWDFMMPGKTVYWRVDEVNDLHPDSPWKGNVWNCTIAPYEAYGPEPADGANNINPDVTLSWTATVYNAKSHTVYFGDNFKDVNDATGGLPQETTSYTPGSLEFDKTYYWRIDVSYEWSILGQLRKETFKGNVWSFKTVPSTLITDPNLAHNPGPPDKAIHPDTWASLSWSPGRYAVSHNVYFGDNFEDVNEGTIYTFRGNQPTTFFVVGFGDFLGLMPDIVQGATYYWRIDEVNDLHPDSPWKGDVWSFWLPPRTAYDPVPADDDRAVDPNVNLSWTAAFNAKLHTVYFGKNSADVEAGNDGTYKGTFMSTNYIPGTLELDKTYYWRIDEFDGYTTYKGDVWSFTTGN